MDRRRLIAVVASLAFARAGGASAAARLVVLVRQPDGLVAVDPCSGAVVDTALALATPVARVGATPAVVMPALLSHIDGVGYWMASPGGDAVIYRLSRDAEASWWWRQAGEQPRQLDLPAAIEPGLPSGTVGRWFHGATLDAAHLGTGVLRLVAVDLVTGNVVLDRSFDRRLELAATAISENGSMVGHVQGGNTRIDIWAIDLDGGWELEATVPIQPAVAAAPSAIDLEVAGNSSGPVLAAGLRWDWPGHPDPRVIVAGLSDDGLPLLTTVPGELAGIVQVPDR